MDRATQEPFCFDLGAAAREFQEHGWVHLPGGAAGWLFDELIHATKRHLERTEDHLTNREIQGKKSQFLWELPKALSIESLCDAVARIAMFAPERTVLAERHVNIYDETAPEYPPPHKDRSASQLALIVGVDVADDSRLMIWPSDHLDPNPYPTSKELRDSRRPDQQPETLLATVSPVEIDVRAGDVTMFKGAAIYHERYRAANSIILALKFNGDGLDPLGEDPRTLRHEETSAALLADDLRSARHLELSPRVIGLRTDRYLPSGTHTQVRLIDRDIDVALTDSEVELINRVEAERVIATHGLSPAEIATAVELVSIGVLLAD